MRLIDEKALKEYQMQIPPEWIKYHLDIVKDMVGIFTRAIDNQPTIDAEPVRHGRWILEKEPNGVPYCFHCSICDSDFRYLGIKTVYNYCPNCGAKMDEEVQND